MRASSKVRGVASGCTGARGAVTAAEVEATVGIGGRRRAMEVVGGDTVAKAERLAAMFASVVGNGGIRGRRRAMEVVGDDTVAKGDVSAATAA
jgi:hypothetical protein